MFYRDIFGIKVAVLFRNRNQLCSDYKGFVVLASSLTYIYTMYRIFTAGGIYKMSRQRFILEVPIPKY